MNILRLLKTRFRPALAELVEDPADLLEMIRPAQDPKFGDYQANFAMPLGKKLGKPPREIAAQIVEALQVSDLCQQVEVAGPGFINLHLADDWTLRQLTVMLHDERLGVPAMREPQTYVVDYSAPNVAKPMHVGHIRSTVIGDALCHILRFLGHRVIGDNHLGDWGTQFGMIIHGYRHFADQAVYQSNPVEELGRVYKLVRRLMDYQEGKLQQVQLERKIAERQEAIEQKKAAPPSGDKALDKKEAKALRREQSQLADARAELQNLIAQMEAVDADAQLSALARQHADICQAVLKETARLHSGDEENLRLWKEFLPKCQQDIERIYRRLGVSFDYQYGESFYHDRLAGVVDELIERGLARESDGAICVFLDGFKAPMIIRKQDGAYLYATTDLATIRYRMETWQPDAILYVVDFRQGEHFEKLFATARLWDFRDLQLTHVSFGTVLGNDGRPFKTRSGDTVGLEGLLDEAVRRAHQVVSENDDAKPEGPELLPASRQHVAEVVGIAALKYADLVQNRTSDYVFSYDKMLSLNGNTATYMQYAYARVRNIFARGAVDAQQLIDSGETISFSHPAERALGLELLRFPEALDLTVLDYRPSQLTSYLFQLADQYSTFYEQCPVLRAESQSQRNSRLLLCDLTARVLRQGLALLGIDVVEKM